MHTTLFNFIIFLIVLLSLVIGYFIGSVNFGKLIAKIKKIDLLNSGSKNPGATNLARVSKVSYGIITAFGDLFKIIIAGWLFYLIYVGIYHGFSVSLDQKRILKQVGYILIYLTPVIGVVAHCFPVYSKFNFGGKGVASFAGLCFFISPWMGLIFMGLWWTIQLSTKYVSLASIMSTVLTTFLFWIPELQNFYWLNETHPIFLANEPIGTNLWVITFIGFLASSFLIVYRHKENIIRLINKQESKFYFRKKNR